MSYTDIVFDGPPGPTPGRFVEVEDDSGASVHFGEWVERDDGYWALRIHDAGTERLRLEALVAANIVVTAADLRGLNHIDLIETLRVVYDFDDEACDWLRQQWED